MKHDTTHPTTRGGKITCKTPRVDKCVQWDQIHFFNWIGYSVPQWINIGNMGRYLMGSCIIPKINISIILFRCYGSHFLRLVAFINASRKLVIFPLRVVRWVEAWYHASDHARRKNYHVKRLACSDALKHDTTHPTTRGEKIISFCPIIAPLGSAGTCPFIMSIV